MERTYNFPVFATQGGGLVREIDTKEGCQYIFVEASPDFPELPVGSFMPEQWGVHPANQRAINVIFDEQFG